MHQVTEAPAAEAKAEAEAAKAEAARAWECSSAFDALRHMSVQSLRQLAAKANQIAADLQKIEPSYAMALQAGIKDKGYSTVANGYVSDYSGEAIITMANGSRWKAIGRGPQGNAYTISRDGFIEFIPLAVG